MTRAPRATERPLVRMVAGGDCDYVVGINELGVTIRPKRSRDPQAVVFVPWEGAYRRALMVRAAGSVKRGRVKPRRGRLQP